MAKPVPAGIGRFHLFQQVSIAFIKRALASLFLLAYSLINCT